jgi:histidinol-phosphate aminotransferase
MGKTKNSRREWLKSAALLAAGLSTANFTLSKPSQNPVYNPYTGEWMLQLPEQPLKARLMYNENPYGPSEKALKALKDVLGESSRYAFSKANELKEMIAQKEGLTADHIFISAGSLEFLALTGLAYGLNGGNIISAYPTFQSLMDTAAGFNCEWKRIAVDKNYKHDLGAMENAIDDSTKLMYICNPNNPTGTLLDTATLAEFCKQVARRIPVFVDEAYTEFHPDPESISVKNLVKEGHNVIIAKTFSKIHGFAGLRVGYALAQPAMVKKIEAFRLQMTTMTGPSIAAAMASYEDQQFMDFCRTKNTEVRELTYSILKDLGYEFVKSNTSFMIFPINTEPKTFLKAMRDQGVGVRSWTFHGKDWCRVSMGTKEEMEIFGNALKMVS